MTDVCQASNASLHSNLPRAVVTPYFGFISSALRPGDGVEGREWVLGQSLRGFWDE